MKCADTPLPLTVAVTFDPSRKQQFSAHATTTDSASTFSPSHGADAISSPSKGASVEGEATEDTENAEKTSSPLGVDSWLLRSPEWLSLLLTKHRGEFLDWLRVPQNAIFVRSTDKYSLPAWKRFAMEYLRKASAPIVKLRARANPILFTEAADVDVRLLLIENLLRREKAVFISRPSTKSSQPPYAPSLRGRSSSASLLCMSIRRSSARALTSTLPTVTGSIRAAT